MTTFKMNPDTPYYNKYLEKIYPGTSLHAPGQHRYNRPMFRDMPGRSRQVYTHSEVSSDRRDGLRQDLLNYNGSHIQYAKKNLEKLNDKDLNPNEAIQLIKDLTSLKEQIGEDLFIEQFGGTLKEVTDMIRSYKRTWGEYFKLGPGEEVDINRGARMFGGRKTRRCKRSKRRRTRRYRR